jgi:hypothetical protein
MDRSRADTKNARQGSTVALHTIEDEIIQQFQNFEVGT